MNEFRVCRVCDYGKWFHAYLREHEKGHKIGLICPACGQGLVAQDLAESAGKGTQFDS